MSTDAIIGIIMVIFFIGFIYFIFWLIQRTTRASYEQWTLLSTYLEVKLNIPEGKWAWFLHKFPTIEGKYKGYDFYNYMYTVGSGKHQKTYTAFKLTPKRPSGRTFQLYKEGFFSKIGKAFGGQDIEVGHPDFDDAFIIKSDDEIFVKRVLNGRIRQLFLRKLPKMSGTFELEDGVLKYDAMILLNSEKNRKNWEVAIDIGIELIKEMEEA